MLRLQVEAITPNAELPSASLSNAELKKKIERSILLISDQTLARMSASNSEVPPTDDMAFLRSLTQFGREITSLATGSVIFYIMCPTVEALDDLYELYTSGKLTCMAIDAYITEEYPEGTTLRVTIDETEWKRCRAELLSVGE